MGATPINELTDESPMLFGAHKGKRMADVPASYLLWLWEAGVWEKTGQPVHAYIVKSWDALTMDAPDAIITHPPKRH